MRPGRPKRTSMGTFDVMAVHPGSSDLQLSSAFLSGRESSWPTTRCPTWIATTGALKPHISEQINELHHRKHHATYVKGANDALAKLAEGCEKDGQSVIFLNEKNFAFNPSGHVNHSIWWKNLSPNDGDNPPAIWPRRSTTRSAR